MAERERHHFVKMGLLALEFDDPALEARFQQQRALNLKSHDLQSYWVYLAVNALFNMFFVGYKKEAGRTAMLLYMVAVLLHGGCMMGLPASRYVRFRYLIVGGFRVLYLGIAAYGIPGWFLYPPDTLAAAWKVVIIGGGVIMTNYTSLGMLVPMKAHVPLQLVSLASFAWWLNTPTCQVLQGSPAGLDLITKLWRYFSYTSKFIVSLIHPVPILESPVITPPVPVMCLNVVTFMQLSLCFLFPTAVVYVIEKATRQTFLSQHVDAARFYPQNWTQQVAHCTVCCFSSCIMLIMMWELLCTVFIIAHRHT